MHKFHLYSKFKIEKASDNNAYSYNPCNAFTEGDCSEVAVSEYMQLLYTHIINIIVATSTLQ